MVTLRSHQVVDPRVLSKPTGVPINGLECSRYGDDHGSSACEARADADLGAFAIAAALCIAVGVLWWRHKWKKVQVATAIGGAPDESQHRGTRRAEQDAVRQQLAEEYRAKLEACDPDVLESSRDFADNEGTPWRVEVGMAIAILVLVGSVGILIAFFTALKALTH